MRIERHRGRAGAPVVVLTGSEILKTIAEH
jgi:hypothetical protein